MPEPSVREEMSIFDQCRANGVRVSFVPTTYELYLSRAKLVDVAGLPLVRMEEHAPGLAYRILKRTMDLSIGTALAVLNLPFLLIAAVSKLLHGRQSVTAALRHGCRG